MITPKKILILIILFILAGTLQWFSSMEERSRAHEIRKKYPIIKGYDSLRGIIINKIDVRRSFYHKGSMLLEFNDGMRFCLLGTTQNKSYKDPDLDEFLQIGDSIIKRSGSNDIYIYRDNKEYHFVLEKVIN